MATAQQPRDRRTEYALFWQGVLYFGGVCFVDTNTIIPLFIQTLTGRAELAGIAATIRQLGTLSMQILLGTALTRVADVPRALTRVMAVSYGLPLLLAPVALYLREPGAATAMVLVVVALMWIADGAVVVAWFDLFGRMVPRGRGGRLLGLQQLVGGVGALGCAGLAKLVLDYPGWTLRQRYALIFLLGGLVLLSSTVAMGFARDRPHVRPLGNGSSLPASLRASLASPPIRAVLLAFGLFTAAGMFTPHLIVWAATELKLPETTVTWLIGAQVAGTLLGGLGAALLDRARGSIRVVVFFCASLAAAAILALVAPEAGGLALALLLVSSGLTGVGAASWVGFYNALIHAAPESIRPEALVTLSAVALPLSLAPSLAGWIALAAGGRTLFAVSALLALASLAVPIVARRTIRGGVRP